MQRERSELVLGSLEKFDAQRIRATSEEMQPRLVFVELTGGHAGINQRDVVVIEPQPRAVAGPHDDFILASLISE